MTVTLLVGLGTILMSGVASSFVTYRLTRAKEHEFFMRQKAEELYVSIEQFSTMLGISIVRLMGVAARNITFDQMNDQVIADRDKEWANASRHMEMLVRIYFPEAQKDLMALFAIRSRLSQERLEFKMDYVVTQGESKDWAKRFGALSSDLSKASSTLLNTVVELARRHVGLRRMPIRRSSGKLA